MATAQPLPRLLTPPRNAAREQGVKLPVLLAAGLFYFLLIPEQANFRLAGLLLSPYRLYLIVGFLLLVGPASKQKLKFAWPDLGILLGCFWIALASYMTTGKLTDTLAQGGAHGIDIGLSYFFMRLSVRSPRDLRLFLVAIAPAVAGTGAILAMESVSGRLIVQPIFSSITGQPLRGGVEFRLGLARGVASFPHAILAGICLASFMTIYWMSGLRGWPKIIGFVGAFGAFFTMSSAALLGLLMGGLLIAYDWLSLRFRNFTWSLFLAGSTILFLTVELVSNSGFFNLLVRFASLNTVSAYNRVLIWKYGSESVMRHPFFGIGYEDWDRPSWMNWSTSFSVDHFWLILAMRFGLPVSVFFIFATAMAVLLVARRSTKVSPVDARLMRGVAIALAVFALGAISVSLWLNALVWFFMLVGISVTLGSQPDEQRLVRRMVFQPAPKTAGKEPGT